MKAIKEWNCMVYQLLYDFVGKEVRPRKAPRNTIIQTAIADRRRYAEGTSHIDHTQASITAYSSGDGIHISPQVSRYRGNEYEL